MRDTKLKLILGLLIIMLFISTLVTADYTPLNDKEILLLHSYHKDYKWTARIDQGIRDEFKEANLEVSFKTEYLDTKNYNTEDYFSDLYQIYRKKYADKKFDLIIASDDYALNFLLDYKKDLFSNTPVVFCGVNNFNTVDERLNQDYTGIVEKINFEDTIEVALKLHPNTNKIVAITDKSMSGSKNVELVDEALAGFFSEIDYNIYRFNNINRVNQTVQNLKSESIILLAGVFKDDNNDVIPTDRTAQFLSNQTGQPIYSVWDFYLRHGIVGGKLVSGYYHGTQAAQKSIKILRGQKPAEIKITNEEATKFMFDAQVMEKFKIAIDALPDGSIVVNQKKSYYEVHKKLFWIVVLGALVLILITIILLRNITKRSQAEDELRETNNILEFQISLERLIAHLSTQFISLDHEKLNKQINKSLQSIAQLLKADRSYIFLIDQANGEMNNAWEWCEDEISPQINNLQKLPLDTFPWVMNKLYNLENIVISDVDDLPQQAENLKQTLKEQDIKSAILIPIPGKESIAGFWGIDAVDEKKAWNNNIINLLQIIGEIFGNALKQSEYEAKLKRNQERLQLSLWGANIGLWDWNVKEDEVNFNKQWANMFGYDTDNIKNDLSTWKDMIHPEDKQEAIKKLNQHLDGEIDHFESEHRMRTKSGNWKWVLGRGRVVTRDEDKNPLRVVGVHVDISDKKELDNMKSELISTVSHEIRTPLSSVLGFTELLIERDLPEEKRNQYLELIHRESNRLKNLINDFLDIQRIETGGQKLDLEEINLDSIVNEVVELYEIHDDHQFEVEFETEENRVIADYNKIKQVVTNLVSNSVKYSNKGSKILISINSNQERFKIEVKDQGIGIAKEEQKNLFERFYRSRSSTKNQIEGTGLGLAICKKIVAAHGGEIGVESELNEGSIFYFTIPKQIGGGEDE